MGIKGAQRLITVSPTCIDGVLGRIVTYPDGSMMIQKWVNRRWVTDENRIVGQSRPQAAPDDTLANYTVSAAVE